MPSKTASCSTPSKASMGNWPCRACRTRSVAPGGLEGTTDADPVLDLRGGRTAEQSALVPGGLGEFAAEPQRHVGVRHVNLQRVRVTHVGCLLKRRGMPGKRVPLEGASSRPTRLCGAAAFGTSSFVSAHGLATPIDAGPVRRPTALYPRLNVGGSAVMAEPPTPSESSEGLKRRGIHLQKSSSTLNEHSEIKT